MRTRIAAGNWKMNLTAEEAQALALALVANLSDYQGNAKMILSPPFPYLSQIVATTASKSDLISVAAQNVHQKAKGAYTGDTAASMIASVGATHVIIGHSERRTYYQESNALLASKIDIALANTLVPIYCIGETLEQREAGQTLDVIRAQVEEGSFHLSEADFSKLIVAYEPVWAIGTGKTASPDQAQEVHAFIRGLISDKYGASIADDTTILYGGSVKPANADDLFAQPDIDGGLVGGASLKPDAFTAIIQALG
ncbi:MAG: triose-phosphate isomerase [Bacteroidota bacterium]